MYIETIMIEDISPGNSQSPTDETNVETHQFSYDRSDSQSIGVSITRAVASVSGVDPLSLEPRLYDVIDPDAVETLLSSEKATGDVQITFCFGSYTVTVSRDEEIIVQEESTPTD